MPGNPNPLASQRNLMNIRAYSMFTYAMINHFQFGDVGLIPNTLYTGGKLWPSMIDAQGWPNDPAIHGHGFNGGGIRFPSTDNYGSNAGENYIIDWTGTGEFTFSAGSWTLISSTNASQIGGAGSGHFKSSVGAGATSGSITVNLTGLANAGGLPNLLTLNFTNSDLDLNGNYIKNFRIYRSGDASRLAAGKIFRLPFLQAIVDLNPSAVRFMDWIGGNDAQDCRWENRCLPDHGTYTSDYTASPPYVNADYVAGAGTTHQYTLAASAGTTGNPKTTPVAMTHGEVCVTQLVTGLVRSGGVTVTAISQAASGVVSAVAHPFIVGDVIFHSIPTASGMQQLDRRKCQVTAVTTNTYTINVNTSAFTVFSGTATATFYVSLNVGARGDFPIVFSDGGTPPTLGNGLGTGTGYLVAAGTYAFWFDKNVSPMNDSSGVPIPGAWLFTNRAGDPNGSGPQSGLPLMPIEVCTQLVLEANALSVSQGINNPIHMWLNCPFRGMLSMDSDYSSASNFATKMVDAALNGTTVNGVTYSGLKSINGPSLLLEHSNETWNGGGADTQGIFLKSAGQAIAGKDNYNEAAGYSMLRSVQMVRDVKGAFPGESRIKYVMASQGTNTGVAGSYLDGSSFYNTNKQAGWGTPLAEHDAFAIAPYLDPFGGTYGGSPASTTFWDDNAKFLGADNSGALSLTCNATTSATLVTTAVVNGPVVPGQVLAGTGIPSNTCVVTVAGVSPNYTLTLNQAVTVALGGTVNSLTGLGAGNYIGAADPNTALQSFVDAVRGVTPLDTTHETVNRYCNPATPTAGIEGGYTAHTGFISGGKVLIHYEGNTNWDPQASNNIIKVFLVAANKSAQWRDATINYWNARAGQSNMAMPAIYGWISGDQNGTFYTWSFASPDNYDSLHTEGQNLKNAAFWAGISARNQALSESGLIASNVIAFSVVQDSSRYQTRMIGY